MQAYSVRPRLQQFASRPAGEEKYEERGKRKEERAPIGIRVFLGRKVFGTWEDRRTDRQTGRQGQADSDGRESSFCVEPMFPVCFATFATWTVGLGLRRIFDLRAGVSMMIRSHLGQGELACLRGV